VNPRAEIGRERRRQIQVRQAFEAGLAKSADDATDLAEFYLACGDYIVSSMARLHDQDQQIHDLLVERLDPARTDVFEQLAGLNERQAKSRAFTAEFQQAVKALRDSGASGQAEFEEAARAFADLFTSLMAPRKNPFQEYTDVHFTDSDWVDIAGVTDGSLAEEQSLYERVEETAPAGIDPVHYTAVHATG
jgi:hypothetical protein